MVIETERLIIRPLEPEDGAAFAAMAADGSLNDIGFDRDCGGWIQDWVLEARRLTDAGDLTADYLAYTVVRKDGNLVIGSVGCSYYADLQETGVTYFIGAQYRGHGYAAEAVHAYAQAFFRRYGSSRLIATVREDNVPSWKVVEKAGFRLAEKRRYQDLNDSEETLYRFYEMKNSILNAGVRIMPLRSCPERKEEAAAWFASKWGIPLEAYLESMEACLKNPSGVPQWYLVQKETGETVAGLGLIANDFHKRPDLTPNVCAVYVEPEYRGQGIARMMLNAVRTDAAGLGFQTLYLLTDHTDFYERCGWSFHCMVENEDGSMSRMYRAETGT